MTAAELSPLSARLAEVVAASTRQTVSLEQLYAAAVAFDRSLATAVTARADLRAALDQLAAAGVVVFPKASAHFDTRATPDLPAWVRRPARPRAPAEPIAPRVWPPILAEAGRIASRANERDLLEIIAAFLRAGGAQRPSVPVRERSLELFGDEKKLDGLLATRLFTSGALTLELLRAHPVPPPLVAHWIPGAGAEVTLLIAENLHTYASLLEVSRRQAETGGPGRHVGYGAGGQFTASVASIASLSPAPARIRYFGDLDQRGLSIPAAADLVARNTGLPPVEPALPLYELLLELDIRRPAPPVAAEQARHLTFWLGPLAVAAEQLLVKGIRLPQEAVGLEILQAKPGMLDER